MTRHFQVVCHDYVKKQWLITINSQNRKTNKDSFNNKFGHKYVTVVSTFIGRGTGMI